MAVHENYMKFALHEHSMEVDDGYSMKSHVDNIHKQDMLLRLQGNPQQLHQRL